MTAANWHCQPTSVTVRLLPGPDKDQAYADRVKPVAMAQAELLGAKLAYLHAASRTDGGEVTVRQWKGLARQLRADHGVLYALMERNHHYIWVCTETFRHTPLVLPGLNEPPLKESQ
ncbi:MAG TPA: hypothetical protein VGF12_07065 [Roseateles sp.]|uniref:hypothetical protein n=1 Tax=Roseateles sp. TaxID=1971397 RepID=UPI002ED896B3